VRSLSAVLSMISSQEILAGVISRVRGEPGGSFSLPATRIIKLSN
jgi:hypothetical protein